MKCSRCSKESSQSLCDKCFVLTAEKRMRKHIKSIIEKGDILEMDTLSQKAADRLIKFPISKGKGKKIIALPMEHFLAGFLQQIMSESSLSGKKYSIFEPLTEKELKRYADYLGESYEYTEKNPYLDFLYRLQPDIRYSLYRSMQQSKIINMHAREDKKDG